MIEAPSNLVLASTFERSQSKFFRFMEVGFVPANLLLFAFFLGLSPSLRSVFLIGSLLGLLVTPYYNKALKAALQSLWAKASLVFFGFILIACFWSEAPYFMQGSVVSKYLKLLYLPILALGFRQRNLRFWAINSYLAAVLLTCLLSILKAQGFIASAGDAGAVFFNHILTGFILAFGAYLAGSLALQFRGWARISYVLLALLCSYQIFFVNTGRTGYLIYLVLMLLLLIQHLSFKKAALGFVFLAGLLILIYQASPLMQKNIHNLQQDLHLLQQKQENTSLGFRMQFHHYAQTLFSTHPILGIGTGGFKYRFLKENPIPAWNAELNEPHSQYWMTLSEQGLMGLCFLLFFLASLMRSCIELKSTQFVMLGILPTFCLCCFSDTVLCYSSAGFLLILMAAISLGELLEDKPSPPEEVFKTLSPESAWIK